MRRERYGLWLILVSAALGLLFAVILSLAPNAILNAPGFSRWPHTLGHQVLGHHLGRF